MKDFIRGTIGKLLQILLSLLGIFLLIVGLYFFFSDKTGLAVVMLLFSIISFSGTFGIRYWLGTIYRQR